MRMHDRRKDSVQPLLHTVPHQRLEEAKHHFEQLVVEEFTAQELGWGARERDQYHALHWNELARLLGARRFCNGCGALYDRTELHTCDGERPHSEDCKQRYRARVEWDARWPRACKCCAGTGVLVSTFDSSASGVALSAGSMNDVEPCSCVLRHTCPRCGVSADLYIPPEEELVMGQEGPYVCCVRVVAGRMAHRDGPCGSVCVLQQRKTRSATTHCCCCEEGRKEEQIVWERYIQTMNATKTPSPKR